MESRSRSSDALGNAARLVIAKGRLYRRRWSRRTGEQSEYTQLRVFSKERGDMELLVHTFGGNFYKHGVGMIWVVGRNDQIQKVLSQVKEVGLATGDIEGA